MTLTILDPRTGKPVTFTVPDPEAPRCAGKAATARADQGTAPLARAAGFLQQDGKLAKVTG